MALFDFAQHAADVGRGSNSATRREIFDAVSLNRTLSDATLCIQKRKPFDLPAGGLVLSKTRGDSRAVELIVRGIRAWELEMRVLLVRETVKGA
ncbi:MAG: hypothetical protein IPM18_09415 [Phycisphaerales bacterium]|nr:hypothetical protein [Phycisphaerales bacterium]